MKEAKYEKEMKKTKKEEGEEEDRKKKMTLKEQNEKKRPQPSYCGGETRHKYSNMEDPGISVTNLLLVCQHGVFTLATLSRL